MLGVTPGLADAERVVPSGFRPRVDSWTTAIGVSLSLGGQFGSHLVFRPSGVRRADVSRLCLAPSSESLQPLCRPLSRTSVHPPCALQRSPSCRLVVTRIPLPAAFLASLSSSRVLFSQQIPPGYQCPASHRTSAASIPSSFSLPTSISISLKNSPWATPPIASWRRTSWNLLVSLPICCWPKRAILTQYLHGQSSSWCLPLARFSIDASRLLVAPKSTTKTTRGLLSYRTRRRLRADIPPSKRTPLRHWHGSRTLCGFDTPSSHASWPSFRFSSRFGTGT